MPNTEIDITVENFDDRTGQGVVLIDFWASWCGPCRMQGPIVEKVAARLEGKATVGKCNVDENSQLASAFGVQSIPTLVILKDGQKVYQAAGVHPEEALVAKISEYL
ncbi:thioredoxin [bacterium]|nr:thioredoxin [bacterium]